MLKLSGTGRVRSGQQAHSADFALGLRSWQWRHARTANSSQAFFNLISTKNIPVIPKPTYFWHRSKFCSIFFLFIFTILQISKRLKKYSKWNLDTFELFTTVSNFVMLLYIFKVFAQITATSTLELSQLVSELLVFVESAKSRTLQAFKLAAGAMAYCKWIIW
jgi:hypothetical protein